MDTSHKLPQGNISKTELAQYYFPHASQTSALKSFMRMLNRNKDLMRKLCKETGYHKHAHLFSPRQVELIVRMLGEPRRDKLFDTQSRNP